MNAEEIKELRKLGPDAATHEEFNALCDRALMAERLAEALREIRSGLHPEDYGRYDICVARLLGIAHSALEDYDKIGG